MSLTQTHDALDSRRSGSRTARRAWIVVALLFLFMFFNFADKAVVGLAGVEMIKDLGINAEEFGLVQSSFFWLYAVGAIVGGLLVGRIPIRWLLAATATLWVLALLPMVWSTSFTVLVATRVLLGFAEGPTASMAFTAVHSWFAPEKRALPTSIVTTGASIGPVVAAPLITAVILHFSWHTAFAVMAVGGAAWVLAWLLLGREGGHPTTVPGAGARGPALPDRFPLRRLVFSRTVLGILLIMFAAYCAVSIKVSWLPLYLHDGLGYDRASIGNLITLPYLASAVMMVLAGMVSRWLTVRGHSNRVARGLVASVCVGIGGASTIGFGVVENRTLLLLLIVVGASFIGASQGVAWTVVSDIIPVAQRGTVIGFLVAGYSLGGIVAPLVLGMLVQDAATDPLAGYSRGFIWLGILLVCAAVACIYLINPERDIRKLRSLSERDAMTTGSPTGA